MTFDLEAKPIRGQPTSHRARPVNREGNREEFKLIHARSFRGTKSTEKAESHTSEINDETTLDFSRRDDGKNLY